jgi:hypothetical protein
MATTLPRVNPIHIKFRVVGIRFSVNVHIDLENTPNPTIKDVMEAARAYENFNFVIAPDGTLNQASVIKQAGTSISSGKAYPAGLYLLSDAVVGENSVTTWQWYHIRGGTQINQPNATVEPYSLMSPVLQHGDEIIWRLVVVATRPKIPANKKAYQNKVDRLPIDSK